MYKKILILGTKHRTQSKIDENIPLVFKPYDKKDSFLKMETIVIPKPASPY